MLVTLISIALAQAALAPGECTYDRDALMALPVRTFDQSRETGWRPVAEMEGCEMATADLIRDYRRTNFAIMTENTLHTSYWHEGQLRAAAGQTDKAILLLMAGTDPNSITGAADYALGTVAFLNRDRPALEAARARLAVLPTPDDWPEMRKAYMAAGVSPVWPPNLDILDGLVACYDQPYRKAYGNCDALPAPQEP